MRGKLQPLRLYTLAPGSETDHELHAYAAGLDPMFHELTVAAREAFIQTAESYGLSEREKFIEKEKAELSAASRRELLLGSEQPYDERTPSAYLYPPKDSGDCWHVKDFGMGDGGGYFSPIDLYMWDRGYGQDKFSIALQELAERIGANKGYVSRLERGLITPSVSTLYRIAAAMGLTVELRPIA